MSALTGVRLTAQYGIDPIPSRLPAMPLKATTKVWAGALVALTLAGYLVPASADPTLRVIGVHEETVDNTLGADGAVNANCVRQGAFMFVNSASTDALTVADVGRVCYAADDQTVARTDGNGTRPAAGRVVGLEGTQVIVEVGAVVSAGPPAIDQFYIASADLSAKQFYAVKQHSVAGQVALGAAAGEMVLGILQNAPANGAVAVVRVFGRSKMVAGGVVTMGDPVAITAAAKAKTAVKLATKTDDAGAALDPGLGSYVLAIAESTTAADLDVMVVTIVHAGAVPSNAS